MISKNLVPGSILSELSFFVVKEVTKDAVIVSDEHGNDNIKISNGYVDSVLQDSSYFESSEEKTMTDLADLFIASSRIAMTVAFYKKDVKKTKKVYDAEVKAAIEKVQNAKVSEVEGLLKSLIENPISQTIPGELRIMKGRHYGSIDELGRIQFVDMEQVKDPSKDYDTRLRQVDPRTIQYVIVNKVKYTLKK